MKYFAKIILITLLFVTVQSNNINAAENGTVQVEWYGHSCFLLTLENGSKILTDPFDVSWVPYQLPAEHVDVIFSSHDHFDHNAVNAVPTSTILHAHGSKTGFTGKVDDVELTHVDSLGIDLKGNPLKCTSIPSFHDARQGELRGSDPPNQFGRSLCKELFPVSLPFKNRDQDQ